MAGSASTHRRFTVVFVCTGNRFRSPIAAALFRLAAGDLPVRVLSIGTLDVAGLPPLPQALALAPSLGIDLAGHRARSLDPESVVDADLVIGFEHAHVAAAVIEGGAPRDRAFTVLEFLGLVEAAAVPAMTDPLARARAAVALAQARRRRDSNAAPREIADPIGGPDELYVSTAETLRVLTRRLVTVLFGDR